MQTQWQWFCLAITFLTRIPLPVRGEVDNEALARCQRWFALAGALIGVLAASIYLLAALLWPLPVAALITLVALLLLTGGLHEDGLADCADGIGGARDVGARLAIMKDSRVGSYGVLALVVSFVGRLLLLGALSPALAAVALIAAHCLSRALAALLMGALPYLRRDESSRVRAMTGAQRPSDRRWLIGVALAVALAALGPSTALVVLAVTGLVGGLAWLFFRRQLGGVTGDALGAAQQVSELAVYLTLTALFPYRDF
ncbi:adenosylcobinamide-GDP ribazoletransferase [Kushneria aurantia]|uniref:Adenosylcobinamide-GDP ribazoletransferase n=1 Tax=Kushneria aurantia TaxID=504092 RepID=A0ABV6G4Q5_9GAMM|nr:adenosylcobinamide-GDP ribazoletransferase [Kushneria aurantia]